MIDDGQPSIQEQIQNEEMERKRKDQQEEIERREKENEERIKKEKLEQEKLEKEKIQKERLEKVRLEKERLEKERLEKERLEQERLEQERLEKEKQLEELQKNENIDFEGALEIFKDEKNLKFDSYKNDQHLMFQMISKGFFFLFFFLTFLFQFFSLSIFFYLGYTHKLVDSPIFPHFLTYLKTLPSSVRSQAYTRAIIDLVISDYYFHASIFVFDYLQLPPALRTPNFSLSSIQNVLLKNQNENDEELVNTALSKLEVISNFKSK